MKDRLMHALFAFCPAVVMMQTLLYVMNWSKSVPKTVLAMVVGLVFLEMIVFVSTRKYLLPLLGGAFALLLAAGFFFVINSETLKHFFVYLLKQGRFLLPVYGILLGCIFLEQYFSTRILLTLLQIGSLIYLGYMQKEVAPAILALFFLHLIRTCMELCQRHFFGKSLGTESVTYLLPLCVAVFFIFMLPVKETPIKWTFAKNAWQEILDTKNALSYELQYRLGQISDDYSISSMGYTDNGGHLLGSISSTGDAVMLTVRTGSKLRNRLYLRGSVYDVYNGEGWEISNHSERDIADYTEDLLLHVYGLNKADLLDFYNISLLHTNAATLQMDTIKTKSVFLPPLCDKLTSNTSITFSAVGNNLRASKLFRKGSSYTVNFLEINEHHKDFLTALTKMQLLAASPDYYTEEGLASLRKTIVQSGNGTIQTRLLEALAQETADSLQNRQNQIYEEDTVLPETLPKRVTELAEFITKDFSTNYEKALAIQAYLSTYDYTLQIQKTPGGDAVDYFLFHSKKGYCTYFASAMTLLCRSAGIPARYVEGFTYAKNVALGDEKEVLAKYAHAWCEVYIDGYGFMIIEPTPGYEETIENAWPVVSENTLSAVSDNNSYYQQHGPDSVVSPEVTALMDAARIQDETTLTNKSRHRFQLVLLIVFSLLVLFLLILLLQKLLQNYRYSKADTQQKIIYHMEHILYALSILLKKSKEELDCLGLSELFDCTASLDWSLHPKMPSKLSKLLTLYEGVRYGEKEATVEFLDFITQIDLELKKQVRNEQKMRIYRKMRKFRV